MNRDELDRLTVKDLRSLAAKAKLPGRSKLKKSELVAALAELQPRAPAPMEPPAESAPAGSSSMPGGGGGARQHQGPDPGLPIPEHYGHDRLTLMAQDPHHLFAYWELAGNALDQARGQLGEDGTLVLVVRSEGGVEQREVDLLGGNYYLAVAPDRTYHGELALRGSDGRLAPIVAAAPATTPPAGPSSRIDEEWMAVDETFEELLVEAGLPGESGSSLTMSEQRVRTRLWRDEAAIGPGSSEQVPALPSSHSLSSSALSSWSLPRR